MALAGGFNPETGTFENLKPVISVPRNSSYTSTPQSYGTLGRRRRGLWSRFNSGVTSIGNWLSTKSDNLIGWLTLGLIGLMVIGGIWTVVSIWISDGWKTGLIAIIGVGVIGTLLWYISIAIIAVIVNLVVYLLRLVFWNAWSLLAVLALILGIYGATSGSSSAEYPTEDITFSQYEDNYFQITARILNVRSAPNTSSSVIGTLKRGDEIEVKSIHNGFAEIEFNGKTGYVSEKYLEKLD
ncbi:MAG: SH3 domain-containing protein [Muribaculaceae bacterium]|nr:SH3 domain-containing protein [Muribaculaceae bacterium]